MHPREHLAHQNLKVLWRNLMTLRRVHRKHVIHNVTFSFLNALIFHQALQVQRTSGQSITRSYRIIWLHYEFGISGACYPEGHPESRSKAEDLDNLRRKVDAGADFLTTQMFFDNNILYNFLYRALQKGINVPVAAGIMPVVNAKQIKRICALSATSLPPRFAAIVDRFQDDPQAMCQAGIAFATEQIIDLAANGVNHIHLYTMNRPHIAQGIFNNLSCIIGG